jgi:hypothetical protein
MLASNERQPADPKHKEPFMNNARPLSGRAPGHPLSPARRAAVLAIGVVLIAAAELASIAGPASATTGVTDVITFTSHVYLTPPPPGGVGHFVIVSDTCQLQPTGAPAVPCTFVGAGTVTATGGTAVGVVTSSRGTIILNETYVFTSPTTLHGSGPATKISGGRRTVGTFTGDFVAIPTSNPNVLLDTGTFVVSGV